MSSKSFTPVLFEHPILFKKQLTEMSPCQLFALLKVQFEQIDTVFKSSLINRFYHNFFFDRYQGYSWFRLSIQNVGFYWILCSLTLVTLKQQRNIQWHVLKGTNVSLIVVYLLMTLLTYLRLFIHNYSCNAPILCSICFSFLLWPPLIILLIECFVSWLLTF